MQGINRPDQPAMLAYRGLESLLVLGGHSTQQCKELAIELANGAFVDEEPALLQVALNFDQLAMVVLVAPADKGQHVQPIGAIGQTDGQNATGVVGGATMRAGRIDTAIASAGHEDRTIKRLNVLLDIPGATVGKWLVTMQTGLAITRDNQPLRSSKAAGWTMPWLFLHDMPPGRVIYEA